MKIDVNSLRDYAVLDGERLAALWAEVDTLRGVIASDDERLKQAALRVWGEHIWGCDTPEMLAEKIEFLRTRVAELERELMVIRDSTGYSGSSGIRGMP